MGFNFTSSRSSRERLPHEIPSGSLSLLMSSDSSDGQPFEHSFRPKEEILKLAWWGREDDGTSSRGKAANKCLTLGLKN